MTSNINGVDNLGLVTIELCERLVDIHVGGCVTDQTKPLKDGILIQTINSSDR